MFFLFLFLRVYLLYCIRHTHMVILTYDHVHEPNAVVSSLSRPMGPLFSVISSDVTSMWVRMPQTTAYISTLSALLRAYRTTISESSRISQKPPRAMDARATRTAARLSVEPTPSDSHRWQHYSLWCCHTCTIAHSDEKALWFSIACKSTSQLIGLLPGTGIPE